MSNEQIEKLEKWLLDDRLYPCTTKRIKAAIRELLDEREDLLANAKISDDTIERLANDLQAAKRAYSECHAALKRTEGGDE